MRPAPFPLNPPSKLPVDVDDIVLSALAEHGAPGCSVAVTHGGRSWAGGYGVARTEPELPFLPETRIPVASMTKPFTATAVMALVQAGKVDLEAPVRRYLPDFQVADPDATERVTVRHLLTHRAGWLGDEPDFVTDRGDAALADQVAAFAALPQVLAPGAAFSYCNTGMDVAGRLVEVVGGGSYESIVEQTILAPLGMTHSTFFAERVASAPAASGHVRGPDDSWQPVQDAWLLPRGVNPSGGLISTAPDLLRWLRWWLGRVEDAAGPLTRQTRARMISDLAPVGALPASTGLGWHVDHVSTSPGDADVASVYHEGSLRGTATVCRFVPEADLGVVVLTNADDGQHVHHAVSTRFLAELGGIYEPDRKVDQNVSETTLAGYVGAYRSPVRHGTSSAAEVTAGTGTLRVRLTIVHFDQPLEMAAGQVEGDLFMFIDGPWRDEPAEFLRTPGGELLGLRVAGRVFLPDGGTA